MDIRFADHPSFHRAVAGAFGTSLLAGLACHPISPTLAPVAGGVVGLAVGGALGYGKPMLRLAAGGLALIPLFVFASLWGVLAASAAIVALGLSIGGPRGLRGALMAMGATMVTLVGMWCAIRIDTARETHAWSDALRDAVAAGAMGLVGIVAMLPRHLTIGLDAVTTAARRMPANLDPEVKNLCHRAIAIWNSTKDRLADSDPGRPLLRDGVLKTLEVATKSAQVKAATTNATELAHRMTDLDARIAASTDDEVKREYQAARSALDDQQRYLDQIAKGRERMVARMHNHVAALEKFQLAATGLEAARTQTAVKQLGELSADVAASGEALAEVELPSAAAN